MACLGFEPGVAGWKVQTNPLSYGYVSVSPHRHLSVCLSFFLFSFLRFYFINRRQSKISQGKKEVLAKEAFYLKLIILVVLGLT